MGEEQPFAFTSKRPPPAPIISSDADAEGMFDLCPCCYRVRGALCATFTAQDTAQKVAALRVLLYAQGLDGVSF